MILNTIFLICWECLWGILPWLIGAWILGWLFWWLFNKSQYEARIAGLEGDISSMRSKITSLESDLKQSYYATNKIEGDYSNIRGKYDNLLLRLKACEEEKETLESKASKIITPTPTVPPPSSNDAGSDIPVGIADTDNVEVKNDKPEPVVVPKEDPKPVVKKDKKTSKIPKSKITPASSKGDSKSGYGAFLKSDNLQIVEGVGPKIESLLKADGITSWSDLANSDEATIRGILEKAGPRYRIHDPKTWPEQGRLASRGEWKDLVKYQKFLGGGKDSKNINSGQSKAEKLYMKARGLKAFAADDLKAIEGIGPKIEGILKAAGIDTWKKLSDTKAKKIKAILLEAGDRYRLADPTTWPKQANLAAKGKWEKLQDYQDSLKGGKE